jgi:hypothetical protein
MFNIGKMYVVKMEVGDGSGGSIDLFNCQALKEEGTLVKFIHAGKEMIVNTASPKFISAELQEP